MSAAARLAGSYLIYYGAVGVFTPFWSPYLASRGFSALEISWVLASAAAVRAVGPLLIGWLADLHHPTRVLRLMALVALASFAILPKEARLSGVVAFSLLFSLSWNSVSPLFDVHALSCQGGGSARYGRIRLWGSVGFILASWLGGAGFERTGYGALPVLMTTLVGLTLIATLLIRPLTSVPGAATQYVPFGSTLLSRATIVALLIAALLAVSFGAYYVFFSMYLGLHGYGKQATGLLWALGVLAEVVVFAAGSALLRRFSIRMLFVVAALGTCVRWLIVAWWVEYPLALVVAQLLHCLGFAVLHFAMVLSAQRLFPAGLASRGQALFSSVGYGLGGMLGNLLAGVIWVGFSPRASYVSAAFIVVLAAVLAILGLRGTVLDSRPAASS